MAVLLVQGDLRRLPLRTPAGRAVGAPGRGCVRHVVIADGERVLDDAVVVGLDGAIELHVHGGVGVVEAVAGWLAERGFPPEAQAAAPAAPAPPTSLRHARALLSCADGPLSALAAEAREALRLGRVSPALRLRLQACLRRLDFAGRLVRPARVRLVGRPNAGKSTLFNALVGWQRSLVSPVAGTTRDTVRARLLLRGVPIVLEDSAGTLGEPDDHGEPGRPGAAVEVDLHVRLLVDDDEPGPRRPDCGSWLEVFGRADRRETPPPGLAVSGLTGQGVPALADAIADALGLDADESCDAIIPVDPATQRWIRDALDLPAP